MDGKNGKDEVSLVNGYTVEEKYSIAANFIKEKEGKAFNLPYADKNYLAALTYLIRKGPYKPELHPDVGLFNVVGRDRLDQWKRLGNMPADEARATYVSMVEKACPLFAAVVEAHRRKTQDSPSVARKSSSTAASNDEISWHEEQLSQAVGPTAYESNREIHPKSTTVSPHAISEEHFQRLQAAHIAEMHRKLAHEMELRAALKAQTYQQFKQYAEQHFPNDKAKQEELMEQLHEQHYQQYMTQVYQQQLYMQHQQLQMLKRSEGNANGNQVEHAPSPGLVEESGGPQAVTPAIPTAPGGVATSATSYPPSTVSSMVQAQSEVSNQERNGHSPLPQSEPPGGTRSTGPTTITVPATVSQRTEQQLASTSSPVSTEEDGETTKNIWDGQRWHRVDAASMWTRKDVEGFKNSLKSDPEGILQVGSSEMVTVRVPTHKDGTSLFWEFATDTHDIGFGLFFEWTPPTSSDEDAAVSSPGKPPVEMQEVEIIPLFRRDSHKEVFCGSHAYPMHGVYLLRFDNSFSLWRSKTLYYRVYYSK